MTIKEDHAYTTKEAGLLIRRHWRTVILYVKKREFGKHVYMSGGHYFILGRGILHFRDKHNVYDF